MVNIDHPTRNSAIADKPRNAFRSQSRSPDMTPFHVPYVFLLVCYSNFVTKTNFQKFDYKMSS